jgi:hypothetical protein
MKRRVGRDDFKSAIPFETEEFPAGGFFFWELYEEFDIVEEDGRLPYLRASSNNGVKLYRPLFDTPHLFLEFARVADHMGPPYEAIDNWISKYGLLGLSRQDPQLSSEPIPEGPWAAQADRFPEVTEPPMRYAPSGGSGDTLDAYVLEFSRANSLLALYEALLNGDSEKLEQRFAWRERCTVAELRDKWRSELEENIEKNAGHKVPESGYFSRGESRYFVREVLDDMLIYKSLPGDWNAFLMDRALLDIWGMVGRTLSVFAYPSLAAPRGLAPLSPEKLTGSLKVRNLLGAMYLQFYWLITSRSDLSRCKYCRRIISYAPPMPESRMRKPRKDKEFCDSRCRQNYHYHNRIKPNRDSK